MSGITKGDCHAVCDLNRALVIDGNKLFNHFFRIGNGIKRLNWRQALPGVLFGNKSGIGHLNLCRIYQHNAGQIPGSECAMNISRESLLAEVWQIARVVHVRVTQNDSVNLFWVKWKATVARRFFLAMALKEAAFEQQFSAI